MKILCFLFLTISSILNAGPAMPEYLYEEWRMSPYPDKSVGIQTNPTALLWPSVKHFEKEDVVYDVYLGRDADSLGDPSTLVAKGQRPCFYNPHKELSCGKWYWKYVIRYSDRTVEKGPFCFTVTESAPKMPSPDIEGFMANVPASHPRVLNYGRDMDEIRKNAPEHPLFKRITATATDILAEEIYPGPVVSDNPAQARKLNQKGTAEVEKYNALLKAYVLTGKKALLDNLTERTEVLLQWPTHDLLGSKVLSALASGFDVLNDELPSEFKDVILKKIDAQFREGLSRWPGLIEARHVENHFWQMEVSGNFTAAIATLGHLESAKEMLAYTYGIFMARFPNLAGHDGGWAEGEGYYSVNKTAVVDMALLVSKLGGVDIFKTGWYRNLPDYFLYFSPAASPVSGFGDMHDRVETGSLKGNSEMMVLYGEENDGKALYRLFSALRPVSSYYGGTLKKDYWKKPLSEVEPWYQIVNDIRLEPSMVAVPENLPSDKVFYGVGAAAIHSDIENPAEDAALFFRASPFGAKGHMHADQNSFNISRKGEKIFYPTGYYTSFADSHSLTSYRHTRAHNSMLVNGIGQAYGHEGYGWIKRHLCGSALSYLCGDASMAYTEMKDKQFLGFLKKAGIPCDAENGFGDAGVSLFDRHIIFAKPDVIIIYDDLKADSPSSWQLLLHTLVPSSIDKKGVLRVETERSQAEASVFAAVPLKYSLTDKFHVPANDFKKKYKNGTPNQYHSSWQNVKKTESMRYLTIIRLADKDGKLPQIRKSPGEWTVGDVKIRAELSSFEPPYIEVEYKGEKLSSDSEKAVLKSGTKETECANIYPSGNYVIN